MDVLTLRCAYYAVPRVHTVLNVHIIPQSWVNGQEGVLGCVGGCHLLLKGLVLVPFRAVIATPLRHLLPMPKVRREGSDGAGATEKCTR
jgi:hypothetical protein